jgi:hypothetical protein
MEDITTKHQEKKQKIETTNRENGPLEEGKQCFKKWVKKI